MMAVLNSLGCACLALFTVMVQQPPPCIIIIIIRWSGPAYYHRMADKVKKRLLGQTNENKLSGHNLISVPLAVYTCACLPDGSWQSSQTSNQAPYISCCLHRCCTRPVLVCFPAPMQPLCTFLYGLDVVVHVAGSAIESCLCCLATRLWDRSCLLLGTLLLSTMLC